MHNPKKPMATLLIACIAMILVILDTKTVFSGAQQGVIICLRTVVPSLFPFIFLSNIIGNNVIGQRIPLLQTIGKICGIPQGAESILCLGLIGGYPVGAKIISDSYESKQLDKRYAQRMLGFCNNAGPAFIFGILAPMFSKPLIPFILWGIHLVAAILVGILLPGKTNDGCRIQPARRIPLTIILENTTKTILLICGWIILFRSLIAVCDHWFLNHLPKPICVVFVGLLELSNGCMDLAKIDNENIRFILASCVLSFGGVCVAMQTGSIVGKIGLGSYFTGKMLQTSLSLSLSALFSLLIYNQQHTATAPSICMMIAGLLSSSIIFIFLRIHQKKRWQSAQACCIM